MQASQARAILGSRCGWERVSRRRGRVPLNQWGPRPWAPASSTGGGTDGPRWYHLACRDPCPCLEPRLPECPRLGLHLGPLHPLHNARPFQSRLASASRARPCRCDPLTISVLRPYARAARFRDRCAHRDPFAAPRGRWRRCPRCGVQNRDRHPLALQPSSAFLRKYAGRL